jgi:hypothetical protein
LLVRFTQLLLHSDCPLGQVQTPEAQVWVLTQALPHRPQLAVLTWVLKQIPEQLVSPLAQVGPVPPVPTVVQGFQTPFWHLHSTFTFTHVEFWVEQQLPNAHGAEHTPPVAIG